MNMKKILPIAILTLLVVGTLFIGSPAEAAFGFVQRGASPDTPGLLDGIWHGMVAPYGLLLGLFTNIGIYAHPNAGWIYDAGFLLGIVGSLPIGWILAIISLVLLIV
jgi:hypothetical protein